MVKYALLMLDQFNIDSNKRWVKQVFFLAGAVYFTQQEAEMVKLQVVDEDIRNAFNKHDNALWIMSLTSVKSFFEETFHAFVTI